MKTFYHYFPFIVLSLLIHYLFLSVSSDNVSPLSATAQLENITTTQFKSRSISKIEPNTLISEQVLTSPETPSVTASILPYQTTQVEENALPKTSYNVSLETHTADEVALLKEYILEKDLVNLPELIITPEEDKTSESMVDSKVLSENKTDLNTESTAIKHNAATTAKRTFKPKLETTNTSRSLLPEATAVSGKVPPYPKRAALKEQKGQVIANMTVLATGTTEKAEIIQSSGHEMLDKAVLNFIAQELFMPTLEGQDKVTSKQSFSYRYE